ncbi:hypothetical protein DUNSADRAFT_8801 [Dunaliella salina]|uniref:Uncharacterized protein n=1 Tax=Dunaliella salina TaxID=3046 RepID=A0ABQ7GIS8_DUNSA|nr:hypothetical protein DUNSADRAFT_8801 [Dunaliella salina]|eukprot:KAF5834508.1 hypothetical protein DUNSADRAFT_8801 [Dunaliella salina]
MSEDFNPYALIERIRNSGSIIKSLRSGKPDASTTAVVQECITLLQNLNHQSDVVVAGLKFMHDALAAAPHTSTLIRLEGGIKIFFKILRTNNSDSQITALSASVLHRCCAASNVTLMILAKEKSLGSTLISAISSHTNNASVMGPIFDLLALVTNHPRKASQLAGYGCPGCPGCPEQGAAHHALQIVVVLVVLSKGLPTMPSRLWLS